mmetsp:Transcript_5782/g.18558  ORF Transcript_5782/g.18558 Transcript_5782/m.18558 type:complete len:190 (+) Transcript_5782:33-602(+)
MAAWRTTPFTSITPVHEVRVAPKLRPANSQRSTPAGQVRVAAGLRSVSSQRSTPAQQAGSGRPVVERVIMFDEVPSVYELQRRMAAARVEAYLATGGRADIQIRTGLRGRPRGQHYWAWGQASNDFDNLAINGAEGEREDHRIPDIAEHEDGIEEAASQTQGSRLNRMWSYMGRMCSCARASRHSSTSP